jgi:ABC-type uncharacterized transport system ATPase subunit
MGVAHVPEDRQRDGLVLPFPIADNSGPEYVLSNLHFSKGAALQFKDIRNASAS